MATSPIPVRCFDCSEVFESKKQLYRHYCTDLNLDAGHPTPERSKTGGKPDPHRVHIICRFCDRKFLYKNKYYGHMSDCEGSKGRKPPEQPVRNAPIAPRAPQVAQQEIEHAPSSSWPEEEQEPEPEQPSTQSLGAEMNSGPSEAASSTSASTYLERVLNKRFEPPLDEQTTRLLFVQEAALRNEMLKEFAQERQALVREHEAKFAEEEKVWQMRMDALNGKFDAQLARAREKYEAELEGLKKKHKEAMDALKMDHVQSSIRFHNDHLAQVEALRAEIRQLKA
ncbi:uncharacterized protein PV09_03868 [Verruconis gallopava]|uniref:Uncharacterized protein n=1 Tax=Verruconis gallopava TaxID=253628 RepID=A0A0D1YXC0_9PEZI|nr:uncharacterized protein PV09_03868 [Verruconis gallopava]KIW05352.1 hypothetical protein PV09_03868 [Verruconis gallopava]